MKTTRLTPRATKMKIAGVGFLIALMPTVLLYFINSMLAVFVFFWLWLGFTAFLMHFNGKATIKQENALAIVAVVKEIQYTKKDEKTGREIQRQEVYPRVIDFQAYLEEKGHNRNIAIIGMAGSGKTELTYFIISQMQQYHKVIFQYKNSDRYRELGFPVLYLRRYSPNVFKDKEAFTQAWITAFTVENRGITASQIIPLIRNAVNKCLNWQEFKEEIDKELKEQEGTITGNALTDIRLKLDSVYSKEQYEIDLPDDIVVDFEGLNKDAFVFYAEYLLRELYEQVKTGTRRETMIFVDEAHVFTRTNNTIIPELSAIIRSRGAFLFATQRASTIAGDVKGNAGIQFCFKQTERDDLNVVSALSEPYHWIVQRLPPYSFVDLAQAESEKGIFVFRVHHPKPAFKSVVEWKPEANQEKETRAKKPIDEEAVIGVLNKAMSAGDVGKALYDRGYDVPDGEKARLIANKLLTKMADRNAISEIVFAPYTMQNNGVWQEYKKGVVYARKGTYDLHDFGVLRICQILDYKGFIPKPQAHGLPLADILIDQKKDGKPVKIAIEFERGKNGYKIEETRQRIVDFEKQGYKVCIVVPSGTVKEKYKEAGFANVLDLKELMEAEL